MSRNSKLRSNPQSKDVLSKGGQGKRRDRKADILTSIQPDDIIRVPERSRSAIKTQTYSRRRFDGLPCGVMILWKRRGAARQPAGGFHRWVRCYPYRGETA